MSLSHSQNIFLYKLSAFSLLMKQLSHTVGITFAARSSAVKINRNFFFSLYNFMNRRFIATVDSSNLSIHLREALYLYVRGFSLTYLNYQCYCFCVLGPLLNKIRVT